MGRVTGSIEGTGGGLVRGAGRVRGRVVPRGTGEVEPEDLSLAGGWGAASGSELHPTPPQPF
eukprot:763615-Hanusia_phi.AAC.1